MRTFVGTLALGLILTACGGQSTEAPQAAAPAAPAPPVTEAQEAPGPYDPAVFCASLEGFEATFLQDGMNDAQIVATLRLAATFYGKAAPLAPAAAQGDLAAVADNFTAMAAAWEAGDISAASSPADLAAAGHDGAAVQRAGAAMAAECPELFGS